METLLPRSKCLSVFWGLYTWPVSVATLTVSVCLSYVCLFVEACTHGSGHSDCIEAVLPQSKCQYVCVLVCLFVCLLFHCLFIEGWGLDKPDLCVLGIDFVGVHLFYF